MKIHEGKLTQVFARVSLQINAAAEQLGSYPVFLRTGHGSGKHNWESSCHVPRAGAVPQRVVNLIKWSEMVDFLGLPYRFWAVRELLPGDPVAVLPRYGNMPLVKELRAFVWDGRVLCVHPYWPREAVAEGLFNPRRRELAAGDQPGELDFSSPPPAPARDPAAEAELDQLLQHLEITQADRAQTAELLEGVAQAFAGDSAWSVDLLQVRGGGWVVTDMAEAGRSFHWPGCPLALHLQPG